MSENELNKTEETTVSEVTDVVEEQTPAAAEVTTAVTEELSSAAVSSEEVPSENEPADEEQSDGKVFSKKKRKEKEGPLYEVLDWLRTICIGVLAGIFIVVFLVQRDDVYGSSMVPTLYQGDIIFTQKLSTYFKTYKRGDIVVLDGKNMEGYTRKEYLVKRIVGLPGETVRIADDCVYIKPADSDSFYMLQENYLPEGTKTTMMDEGRKKGYDEITLGEDEYYCLGDNRPVSNDSRNLGPFTEKRIVAVAVIRVFPLNEIKVLAQTKDETDG